jgi:hypothetical protein
MPLTRYRDKPLTRYRDKPLTRYRDNGGVKSFTYFIMLLALMCWFHRYRVNGMTIWVCVLSKYHYRVISSKESLFTSTPSYKSKKLR